MSVTDWDQLPLCLGIADVARLWNRSERAIERLVRLRRFPAPTMTRPARWSRADLQAHWEGKTGSVTKFRKVGAS